MKLKHTKYTVINVDYGDLENLINEEIPHLNYEICAENDWDNGSLYEVDVSAHGTTVDDLQHLGSHCSIGYVMNALCEKGAIEEGTYLIDVCW